MSEQRYRMVMVDSARGKVPIFQINNKNPKTRNKQSSESIQENLDIHIGLFKRFETFLLNQKLIKLSTALKRHCGRHFPIGYRPEFGFREYWEDQTFNFQDSIISQFFQFPNWYYFIFALLILVSKLVMIWQISIHRLFQEDAQNCLFVMFWGILTMVFDILMQFQLFSHYEYFKQKEGNIFKYVRSFWKDILVMMYFVTIPVHYQNYSHGLLVLDILVMVLLSRRCEEIKRSFRIEITSTSYKDAFNVVELFSTLLPIAHIFALALYYVAVCNTEQSWLITKNYTGFQPLEKYVYSLYFAFTTMLTVGYGDITPVTIPEILVVICIQIIGIITYGYIVNEIGHIIGHMRKEDQILSRDISTISKMARYYDLDNSLVEKAKNFLVCQKKEKAALTPEEEEKTLSKLHDDLRQEISQENSLRILKSSLFYVCNWTKKFQIQTAKKLHKKIFSPNEQILQVPGKERIYIFKKGKVEIQANRSEGYKKHFQKILRIIEPRQTLEVSDNIYGYSFIMSNTPIKLMAVNKEFVVAYYVDRKDFLQTVMNSHLDSEYYFEMKTKIDSVPDPQSWEAPLIINTKEHYIPSIQYLIKKYKSLNQKQKNIRSSKYEFRRFRKRTKRVLYSCLQELEGEYISCVVENIKSMMTGKELKTDKILKETTNAIGTMREIEENQQISSLTYLSGGASPKNEENFSLNKENLHFLLEQGREYSIYFRRFNRSQIIMKLEKSNYMMKNKKMSHSLYKFAGKAKNQISMPSIFKDSLFSEEE